MSGASYVHSSALINTYRHLTSGFFVFTTSDASSVFKGLLAVHSDFRVPITCYVTAKFRPAESWTIWISDYCAKVVDNGCAGFTIASAVGILDPLTCFYFVCIEVFSRKNKLTFLGELAFLPFAKHPDEICHAKKIRKPVRDPGCNFFDLNFCNSENLC